VTSALDAITKDNAALLATALQDLKTTIARGEAAKQAEDLTQQIAKSRALLDGLEVQHAAPKIRSIECIADDALAQLDRMYHSDNRMLGLSWGFPLLDEVTLGIQPATTNILYGATSMGKTTLAASVIRHNLGEITGLIIPTETQSKRYLFRLAASVAHISSDKIESGELTADEYQRVRSIIVSMKKLGWRFLEHPQPTRSMLRSAVLDAAAAGCKLVLIDSISRLASAGDYSATSALNNDIQALAIETGLAFLMTSQVGRDVSERKDKTPKLTDAYGGGVIENNADFVLGLYRHDYYVAQYPDTVFPDDQYPTGTASGQVLKNRNGSHMGAHVRFKYIPGAGFYPVQKPALLNGATE
jgi:replicative DNA helicase